MISVEQEGIPVYCVYEQEGQQNSGQILGWFTYLDPQALSLTRDPVLRTWRNNQPSQVEFQILRYQNDQIVNSDQEKISYQTAIILRLYGWTYKFIVEPRVQVNLMCGQDGIVRPELMYNLREVDPVETKPNEAPIEKYIWEKD